jgi:hypothetical protein
VVIAPTENTPATSAADAAVAKARIAKFLFILICLLLVWTATGDTFLSMRELSGGCHLVFALNNIGISRL